MIFALSALAAPVPYGELDGEPLTADVRADGTVVVARGAVQSTVKAPPGACEAHVGRAGSEPAFRVRWVCDARTDRFGTVSEAVLTWSGAWRTSGRTGPTEGVAWLVASVQSAAKRDLVEAHGLASMYASRLQYAAQMEDRERVLVPLLAAVVRENAADTNPERAGLRTLALLQSPPVWEPERPWDFGKRLRVGPPAGNRPAPERIAWLTATPENAGLLRAMAGTLHRAGHHAVALELCENVVSVVPGDAEAAHLLADLRRAVDRSPPPG
ncbi:MAG: hypothetical protein R3F61_10220 [Myxococcota bacterium]